MTEESEDTRCTSQSPRRTRQGGGVKTLQILTMVLLTCGAVLLGYPSAAILLSYLTGVLVGLNLSRKETSEKHTSTVSAH